MGCAQEHIETEGWSRDLLSFEINEPRIRKDNNKLVVVLEELSFLGKPCGRLEPNHLGNAIQKVNSLLRISFREGSQQQRKKCLGRKLLPSH